LQRAYLQLAQERPVNLPHKTTAFIHWARALTDYVRTADLSAELAFWRRVTATPTPRLPLISSNGRDVNLEARAATETLILDADATRGLLEGLPAVLDADMQTALLATLAWAMRAWTGDARLKLAVEGHGRDLELPGVDITRTVGWFTSLYPLALDISGARDVSEAVSQVQAQFAPPPHRGLGYGLLRYLRGEASLAGADPFISFNYLGQFQGDDQGGFRTAVEGKGPERHPRNHRPNLLDFTASIVDDALTLRVTYPRTLLTAAQMSSLLASWRHALDALLVHLRQGRFGRSPASELAFDDDIFDDLLDELEI
jgi:non-ribosomal peptide synthase protein (TIGR01720 family)